MTSGIKMFKRIMADRDIKRRHRRIRKFVRLVQPPGTVACGPGFDPLGLLAGFGRDDALAYLTAMGAAHGVSNVDPRTGKPF